MITIIPETRHAVNQVSTFLLLSFLRGLVLGDKLL